MGGGGGYLPKENKGEKNEYEKRLSSGGEEEIANTIMDLMMTLKICYLCDSEI